MLLLVSASLGILLSLVISGYPFAFLIFKNQENKLNVDYIVFLAVSLICGLGISALSASISYGIFGIENYFYIFIAITSVLWTLLVLKYKSSVIQKLIFDKKDLYLLIPVSISLFLSSTQWVSFLKPQLKVGEGPDISQNIMAAQSANVTGSTWFAAVNSIKEILNTDSYHQAALDLFRIPNSADVAAYDYLVFGTRWGLTVPFHNFMHFFGRQTALLEVGIVLLVSLIALSIIFFAIGKLITKHYLLPISMAIIIISNSSLMFQFYNGGLSQLLGTVSVCGLILVVALILKNNYELENSLPNFKLIIISTAAWLGSYITYVDSTMVISLFFLIYILLLSPFNIKLSKRIFIVLLSSGALSILLTPISAYANFKNLNLRSAAATGTGSDIKIWNFPSVHFGLSMNYSAQQPSNFIKILSALVFLLMLFFIFLTYFSRKNKLREFSALGFAGLITVMLGLYFSLNSNAGTSYIYDKVSTYVTPFVLASLLILISKKSKVNSKSDVKATFSSLVLISLTALSLISGINFKENYFNLNNTTSVPYEIGKILKDGSLQDEMLKTNYLLPYKPTYNFASVLGAKYWISKAPNDFILEPRLQNELRLLCFIGDVSCNPATSRIVNSPLEKFGMVEFLSPITTADFAKLNIDQRFDFNFEVFGMPIMDIPDKFKGGNPYFK